MQCTVLLSDSGSYVGDYSVIVKNILFVVFPFMKYINHYYEILKGESENKSDDITLVQMI